MNVEMHACQKLGMDRISALFVIRYQAFFISVSGHASNSVSGLEQRADMRSIYFDPSLTESRQTIVNWLYFSVFSSEKLKNVKNFTGNVYQ